MWCRGLPASPLESLLFEGGLPQGGVRTTNLETPDCPNTFSIWPDTSTCSIARRPKGAGWVTKRHVSDQQLHVLEITIRLTFMRLRNSRFPLHVFVAQDVHTLPPIALKNPGGRTNICAGPKSTSHWNIVVSTCVFPQSPVRATIRPS